MSAAGPPGRYDGMSRLPRLFVPSLPSHITVRGNDRQAIFHCDGDRLRFLSCLGEAARKNGLAIHAYVLMTNHVHLLATGDQSGSAPRTIQSVGRRYVAYFNDRYERTGTLWEGRYRSALVQVEGYLLACHRYIDLNPVRAGLVRNPGEYQWSSHRFYAWGRADGLVTPHEALLALGFTTARRCAAYASIFDQPMETEVLDQIRFCANKGWALGSPAFCLAVQETSRRRALPSERGWKKGKHRGSKNGMDDGV